MNIKFNIKSQIELGTKLKIITASTLILISGLNTVQAAKKDLTQKITIDSERQSADLKNKIASYLEKVTIRQGSILITADLVQISSKKDPKSGEEPKTYLASGKPAIFQQELEDGTLISLQADEVKYLPHLNIITVSGNAVVKQAGSEVSGSKITYNTLSEKLEAESEENQTVTTVLQPTVLKKQKENKDIQDKKDNK
jgi:lipopolysaccharide export system protein LptA